MEYFYIKDIICALIALLLLFDIECYERTAENVWDETMEDTNPKYTSVHKGPLSTPDDFWTLGNGKDVIRKLIRILSDAEYRDYRNKALLTMTPNKDPLVPKIFQNTPKPAPLFYENPNAPKESFWSKIFVNPFKSYSDSDDFLRRSSEELPRADSISARSDDDILDLDPLLDPILPKIHIHHLFPPHIVRPLQRLIVQKMMEYIRRDPIKRLKRRMKRISRASTAAVVTGIGIHHLKELKTHPPTAHFKVTGVVDLSGQKKEKKRTRYRREDIDYPDDDLDDPHYKTVRDYKLWPDHKHEWPFHEDKDTIYEKWNKFPAPSSHSVSFPDPFHHKVKYLHRSFHELSPDLHHLVKDVHGLVGTKTKIISTGPDLDPPIVLFGQLFKLLDSLIPSIRIRIPFIEWLIKSFFEKSKPKVVYVKQRPRIKYVPMPYPEETYAPQPEPLKITVPITVPMPEPVIVPEPVPYPETRSEEYIPQPESKSAYEPQVIVQPTYQYSRDSTNKRLFNVKTDYETKGRLMTQPERYAQIFGQGPLYQDRKRAKA